MRERVREGLREEGEREGGYSQGGAVVGSGYFPLTGPARQAAAR